MLHSPEQDSDTGETKLNRTGCTKQLQPTNVCLYGYQACAWGSIHFFALTMYSLWGSFRRVLFSGSATTMPVRLSGECRPRQRVGRDNYYNNLVILVVLHGENPEQAKVYGLGRQSGDSDT